MEEIVFSNAVNCRNYITSVINELIMCMEHYWNDNCKKILECLKKTLSQCKCFLQKCHMHWPGTELRPLRLGTIT